METDMEMMTETVTVTETAMAKLPEELFVEILLRLPVKSVKRCRCLSKSLCAFIDSPDFIKSHLCKSSKNFNLRKLIFHDLSIKKFHVSDVHFDPEDKLVRLEKPVSTLLKEVYGNCKGLVLLNHSSLHRKFRLTLWNPSTRKRRHLPECPFVIQSDCSYYSIIGTGLGYDDTSGEYKACYIVHVHRRDEGFEIQVWVYGLRSNAWRRAQDFPYLELKVDRDPGIETGIESDAGFPGIGYFTEDGDMNWLCSLFRKRSQSEIVAFDMKNETFSVVPQPVCSINSMEGVEAKLHVLEGRLCISYFCGSVLPEACLYVRKKDGVDMFTWSKLYSVSDPLFFDISWFYYVNVLGYSKRGDKVMLDFGMPYLVSYDLKDESFGKVEIEKDSTWKAPFLCLQCLVPLAGSAAA